MSRFMITEWQCIRAEAALRKTGDRDDASCADALEIKRRLAALPKSLAEMDRDGVPDDERPWSMRRLRP